MEATTALKKIPGLDVAIRSLLGSVAEEFFYIDNIAASVLVGTNQLPAIHQLLLEACTVLDLEPPQLLCKTESYSQCLYFCHAREKALYGHSYFFN